VCLSETGIGVREEPEAVPPPEAKESPSRTTDLKKFEVRSTTSSQTSDTLSASKRDASGRDVKASKVSCNKSEHRSESSPNRSHIFSNFSIEKSHTEIFMFSFITNLIAKLV
jgi:hypothetical protein